MEREKLTVVGRWVLAAAILVSALALGALHTPVLAFSAVLASAAALLLWWEAEPLDPRPAATALVAVAIGLIAWTALQTVPLPRGIVAALAPANADVWARALTPLHETGPGWITISLDPHAGRVQVLRGLAYLAVYLAALQVARRHDGVVFLERVLVVASSAAAAAALLHPALGVRKIWGLYEPREPYAYFTDHIGPLLNMNHLAGYANVGLLVAWASVVGRRGAIPRLLAVVVVLLLGATTVWSLSRGGTATMLVGVVVVTVVAFLARRTRLPGATTKLAVGIAAIAGAAVLLLSLFDETRSKFLANNLSKLELARDVGALWKPFGLLGLGRGAFESTYPSVRTGTEYFVFTHPENIVMQWTTEWGIPVAVAGFAAVAWALQPRTVLARSRPPIGPWGALVALALHNLVDFSSEVPGVMFALAVCAAIVTGGTGGAPARHRARWAARPRLVALGPAVLVLVGVAITVPVSDQELSNDERSFRDAGLDQAAGLSAFHDRARAAMLRHPAAPYFPYVGAVRAVVVRDESILPWAARALERSPVYGRVHLLLARSLFARHAAQARLEYRIACEQDNALCAVDDASRLVASYDDAMELVPEGVRGAAVLEHMTTLLGPRLPSSVVRLDRDLLERDPTNLAPVQRTSAADLRDLVDDAPWCAPPSRSDCIADGLAAAARLKASAPDRCEGYAIAGELRVAAGEVDAGFAELEGALDHVADRSLCARRMVTLAEKVGNRARVDASLDRLLKLGCEKTSECVENLLFAAGVESTRGSARRSLALVKRAWERAPERDDLLVDMAQRAQAQGLHGEALDAYMKLDTRHPEDPRWKTAIAAEREAVSRGIFEARP